MSKTHRIAIKIEYDGAKFHGSQMQAGVRTVQEDLERALAAFFRSHEERSIKAHFSGRTDTGVHANGQVAHFEIGQANLAAAFKTDEIDLNREALARICWALNGILSNDVSISAAQLVPERFNARFSAIRRTYVYRILNRPQRSALRHNKQYFVPAELDVDAMRFSAEAILGQHDFRAFKSSNSDKSSTICLVERAEILNKGEGELEFWISANHFVYNMVRIIVGTLIEVGLGKRTPSALAEALAGQDRHLAGPTAPPWGLCLYSVDYPAEYSLFQRDSMMSLISSQENES
jgi:tRNA pseudouridine38-40 synthase